jgi:hypothetical protein
MAEEGRLPAPITATELELLEFFPDEPALLDPSEDWQYNDAAYSFESGNRRGSFAIAPAYRDVRLVVECGESVIYELNATSVVDLRIHRDKGVPSLEIAIGPTESVFLRLFPAIAVYHRAGTL